MWGGFSACIRLGMRFIHLALTLAAFYVAIITAMYFAQTWLLFPTTLAGLSRLQLPATAERVEISTPDRASLIGVRIPSTGDPGGPTLIGFGGNAWNAEAVALSQHGLFPDREVVAFHYRGYGPSFQRRSPGFRAFNEAMSGRSTSL